MRKIETFSAIYCFENRIDGKRYVGQAQDFNRRYKRHLFELRSNISNNVYFQRAWNKYGEKNFKFYIVEKCAIKNLDKREIYYIKKLKSHVSQNGYNISWGGNVPMRGVEITEEHRKNLSKALSGEKNPNFGKKISKETSKKISESLMGRVVSKESRKKARMTSACTKQKKSKSKYIGITIHQDGNFVARIPHPDTGNRIYIGYFYDEIEAAKEFDKVCWNLYKDLNKLNFPENYK